MKNLLEETRNEENNQTRNSKIRNTLLICILAFSLGILLFGLSFMSSKFPTSILKILKMLEISKTSSVLPNIQIMIFCGSIIAIKSKTPMRASFNVFLFSLLINLGFHLPTICFLTDIFPIMFEPYLLTILSPVIAYYIWYAKGKNTISIVISSLIIMIFLSTFFEIGIWYFKVINITHILFLVVLIWTLFDNIKNTIISIFVGIVLALILPFLHGIDKFLIIVVLYILAILFNKLMSIIRDFINNHINSVVVRYILSLVVVTAISLFLAFIPIIIHNSSYFMWGYLIDDYLDIEFMSLRNNVISLRSLFILAPGVFAIYEGWYLTTDYFINSDKNIPKWVLYSLYIISGAIGLVIMIAIIDFYFIFY